MQTIITDKDLPVKQERSTIVRVVHNRENPFVQLNKEALWDSNLSLKAVGLWARCMSRPNDWKFSIKELVGKCKEGRRAVDSAMQELIKANYACRLEYNERGEDGKFKHSGIEYVFFEFPATEEEKATQLEIFKKSFRNCGFGDCRNGDCRNSNLLIKNLTEKDSNKKELTPPTPPQIPKEESAVPMPTKVGEVGVVASHSNPKKEKKPSAFSPKVKEVADKMLKILVDCNPVYRPPENLEKFLQQVELMLEKDKQDPDLILKTFEWACKDNEERDKFKGWQSVICSNKKKGKCSNPADIFRGHFGTIWSQMNSQPKRKFAPSSNDAKTIEALREWEKTAI